MAPITAERQRRDYTRHRDDMRERRAEQTHAGQNISPIPECVDPNRRAAASQSLRQFAETYFPAACYRQWSDAHLRVIGRIETAATSGGLFAMAMPRGYGKSTLTKIAAIWAVLNGIQQYVMLIAATEDAASRRLLGGIKRDLYTNEWLLDDFPEVCHPIRKLQNQPARARGQHVDGLTTNMEWSAERIVLPNVAGSLCSEAVISATGLTSGNIRGEQYTRSDGSIIRPTLVVLDDPQTRESARSLSQTDERMRIITGDILGMGGLDTKIAAVCPCTVIYQNDLASRLLDRDENPAWRGEITPLVVSWPDKTGQKLWDEYREILYDEHREGGDGSKATAYYSEHRDAMDNGAEVSWPDLIREGEISALQAAYNMRFRCKGGDEAFFAEYQNAPIKDEQAAIVLTPAILAGKLNSVPRRVVPAGCEYLTAYVDVHKRILYSVISAWSQTFGGGPIDYGTWPEQPRPYFEQADPPVGLDDLYRGRTEEAAILAGLEEYVGRLLDTEYQREDGAAFRIGRLLIDCGYKRDLVQAFARRHKHAAILMPGVGAAIGAKKKPFEEYRREPGMGLHCIVRAAAGERHCWIDTYWWKTMAAKRLTLPRGTLGGWEIFGREAREHELFFDHLTSEYSTEVTANGRTVTEWEVKPNRDNHWWDCLVGSAVGGSLMGARPVGMEAKGRPANYPKPGGWFAAQRKRR